MTIIPSEKNSDNKIKLCFIKHSEIHLTVQGLSLMEVQSTVESNYVFRSL
jgi:hypothetical protein